MFFFQVDIVFNTKTLISEMYLNIVTLINNYIKQYNVIILISKSFTLCKYITTLPIKYI